MPFEKRYNPTDEDKKSWDDCDDAAKQARTDSEHERYTTERGDLIKAEGETEKNLDGLLVTISTLAIGASLTLLKDVAKGPNGWLIFSWVMLTLCLVGSLADRIYSYKFHKNWRNELDDVFTNYNAHHRGHGWKEADARLAALKVGKIWRLFKAEAFLDAIKWLNAGFLTLGLIGMMMNVYVGAIPSAAPAPAAPSVTVNVFNATTQPTKTP